MAGTATATYSADVWSSASTIDGGQQQWEYSVPVNNEVCTLGWIEFPIYDFVYMISPPEEQPS